MLLSFSSSSTRSTLLFAVLFCSFVQAAPAADGCCSMNFKQCDVSWCGSSKNRCDTCGGDDFLFLEDGERTGCLARWSSCTNNINGCCGGLECTVQSQYFSQCLPSSNDDIPVPVPVPSPSNTPITSTTPGPTMPPTRPPTKAPVVAITATPVSPTIPPTIRRTSSPVDEISSSKCGCDSCTPQVLDTLADQYSCGSRINWVISNLGLTESDACKMVGDDEYPTVCGACVCNNNNDNPIPSPTGGNPPPPPTPSPVNVPDPAPTPPVIDLPPVPSPVPEGILLRTDKAMNAWDVFLGLDYMTHVNSMNPPNFSLVASGGAAGSGNLVVSESQSYGLLITGTILASWDTHAGTISGSSRSDVMTHFEGYFNFWKSMCRTSSQGYANCQPNGAYCSDSSTGSSYVCLPDWRHFKTGGSESTGAAPDADEDAIVGIILAVKAFENDSTKPGWWEEARLWADASSTAFFQFNVDKSRGDHRLVRLGSCYGGWEGQGNNPSYHSPGSYRVMRDYQKSISDNERNGYTGVPESEWNKLIGTSHDVLQTVQCSGDGALVPNWATIGTDNDNNIINTGGSFSGSGTPQYEYGSEAARATFRVALDAALYPGYGLEWSPYLSQFNWRLDSNFANEGWTADAFPNCRSDGANQDTNMFASGWTNNAFIYGPTFSALIASTSDIVHADAMLDAAGLILAQPLPNSYYPRSWSMISNLLISGAMESAGNVLRGHSEV